MTWLDEHPEAVEAAAKAAYFAYYEDEASEDGWRNRNVRDEWLVVAGAVVAALSAAPIAYQWGVRWHDADGDPKPVEGEDRLDGYGPHWTKWRRTVGPWEEVR